MNFDWPTILQWAIRHADNLPQLVSLILAAYRAQGFIARMKAIYALINAVEAIVAEFPMPTEQVFGADAVPLVAHLTAAGVSTQEASEVLQALEA